jgi:hypothetical protein
VGGGDFTRECEIVGEEFSHFFMRNVFDLTTKKPKFLRLRREKIIGKGGATVEMIFKKKTIEKKKGKKVQNNSVQKVSSKL